MSSHHTVIFGNSGHAREVQAMPVPVFGESRLYGPDEEEELEQLFLLNPWNPLRHLAYLGVGEAQARKKIMERWRERFTWPTLGSQREVKPGVVLMPGSVIGFMATIGTGCLINSNATIGHDATIGDYSVVFPGANISSFVKIGEAAMIGAGSVILPHVSIGDGAVIGAGAVVTKDVPANVTMVGVPAREMGK